MPFGVTVAGVIFQQKLDQCFGHIRNVIVTANDIMVVWKKQNHRDHDLALRILLETARRCNVHLNYSTFQYKKTEVDFFGNTYMTRGWKPAQTKVSVITSMPEPSCKKQEQSFIGMVNYFSKFWLDFQSLQNLSETCQRWGTIQLGSKAPWSVQLDKKEGCRCPNIGLLQPQKTNYPSDRCKQQGVECMLTTSSKTSILCK